MVNVIAILNDGRSISSQANDEILGITTLREWASSWHMQNGKFWIERAFIGGEGRVISEFKFVGASIVKVN